MSLWNGLFGRGRARLLPFDGICRQSSGMGSNEDFRTGSAVSPRTVAMIARMRCKVERESGTPLVCGREAPSDDIAIDKALARSSVAARLIEGAVEGKVARSSRTSYIKVRRPRREAANASERCWRGA